MTDDEAVVEVGWVAREARELVASLPSHTASQAVRDAWHRRDDEFTRRKHALLAHIEGK